MLERESLLAPGSPEAPTSCRMVRKERPGFSLLAAQMASWSGSEILDAPRSERGFGASASMPPRFQA